MVCVAESVVAATKARLLPFAAIAHTCASMPHATHANDTLLQRGLFSGHAAGAPVRARQRD